MHSWTKDDDIVAFYLEKYGEDALITLQLVSQKMRMTVGSLDMRVRNFKALMGIGKLDHNARLSKEVLNAMESVGKDTHRERCLKILSER